MWHSLALGDLYVPSRAARSSLVESVLSGAEAEQEGVFRYPSWSSARSRVEHKPYARHQPESRALYRIVYHYGSELGYRWEELFQEKYGNLRAEVTESYERYLNCGILKHGCAVACCESCSHSMLIAFSCKRRGVCPSCQAKRSVLFAENLNQNVLFAYPHRHLVFSLPKRLRVYFKFDRSLFSGLYRAVWETWQEYVTAIIPQSSPGAVMALHSAGSLLNWHPHVHVLALDGAMVEAGEFEQLKCIDAELIQEFFTEKVFRFLLEKELISEDVIANMKSWEHSGFNFYAGESIWGDDTEARLFLARYLKKAPLSLERLFIEEPECGEPVVLYVRSLNCNTPDPDSEPVEHSEQRFSPLEFLANLSVHIPLVFEQTTRFYGVYSPRSRGAERRKEKFRKYLESNFEPLDLTPSLAPSPRPASGTWARLIKLVFEVDPLKCPKCGEQMKIKSFILNSKEIDRICASLGTVSWRAPPGFSNSKSSSSNTRYDFSSEFAQ